MWITRRGYENLLKKIDDLEKKKREMLKELGNQADRDSDLPENPIWKQLQVELRFNIPKQISDLQKIITSARIIEDELKSQLDKNDIVHLGSKIKIKINKEERIFILVGPYDIDIIKGGISYLSPLGKALLGAEKNEEKTFITPSGEKKIVIISIEKGL